MNVKHLISVDWLETYCICNQIEVGTYRAKGYEFRVVLDESGVKTFERLITVYIRTMKVATILQKPRIKKMNQKTTLVKLENRILYSQRYIEILYAIFEAFGMIYKGITRLDLCCDMHAFANGLRCDRFIKQYVSTEYEDADHMYRANSSTFTLRGNKKRTSAPVFNSIRWGSMASNVGVYLYDKTLELIEEKDKPWIRTYWLENGLDYEYKEEELKKLSPKLRKQIVQSHGLHEYVAKRVWRMEISIKAKGKDIVDMQTGQLFQLSPRYIESQPNIERLFQVYAKKYCDFRIKAGHKRLRDYEKMQLFEIAPDITAKPLQISICADTGRIEKVCYNKLIKLAETYTNISEYHSLAISGTLEFLNEVAGLKRGTIERRKYATAISNMKGSRFREYDYMEYIDAIALAGEMKRELCAEYMYDAFKTGTDVPPIEIQNIPPPEFDAWT